MDPRHGQHRTNMAHIGLERPVRMWQHIRGDLAEWGIRGAPLHGVATAACRGDTRGWRSDGRGGSAGRLRGTGTGRLRGDTSLSRLCRARWKPRAARGRQHAGASRAAAVCCVFRGERMLRRRCRCAGSTSRPVGRPSFSLPGEGWLAHCGAYSNTLVPGVASTARVAQDKSRNY